MPCNEPAEANTATVNKIFHSFVSGTRAQYIMKNIVLSFVILFSSVQLFSQSYEERIADAINSEDWFALDSIYSETSKDSISDFLELYSRCLIGNRLNRTDVSIPAFGELFNNYSQQMELGNLIRSAVMFSMDLSREGQNESAVKVLSSIIEAVRHNLENSQLKHLEQSVALYSGLTNYSPYKIVFEQDSPGIIPFKIVPAGPEDKGGKLISLQNSSINGTQADIIFDTGAGVNIITDSLARKYNLLPLVAELDVKGIGNETGNYVIAKELKIGNITVYDVPFLILSMSSNNAAADQYLSKMNLIIGSELMIQLKDLTFDFQDNQITVPINPPTRSNDKPNLCFSPTMNLLSQIVVDNNSFLARIDTGDVSYGTLNYDFYKNHKKFVKSRSKKDTIRIAGIGGVTKAQCYKTPDLELTLGGHNVIVPFMQVITNKKSQIKNNLGLRSLMLFKKVRFNMVDFVLSTES